MVAGRPGEDAAVGGAPVRRFGFGVFEVRENDATLRAGKSLVRAAGEVRRALVERILELSAGDQAEHVRAVEENRNLPLAADRNELGERLREQEQTLAEHDQLRMDAIDHLDRALRVHV